jgi:flagellar biogenesis protein FliO
MNQIIPRRLLLSLLILACGLMACSRLAAKPCPGFTLTVIAHAPSWVRVRVDGVRSYTGTMQPGHVIEKRGLNAIRLETGNAGGITVKLNGRKLAPLGRSGQPVIRRYVPPPPPVVKPAPVAAPPVVKPAAPKPVVQAQPKPGPTPAPAPHRAVRTKFPPQLSLYLSLGLLILPFFVLIWMLAAMRREARLLASLGMAVGSGRSIRVISSQRLSRGRTIYLLEAGERLFMVATGGVVLLREVESSEFRAQHD